MLQEVTSLLQKESKKFTPAEKTTEPISVETDSTLGSANIDSTIACIEGAITMYRNSPPTLQPSVLFTLRAALVSAVDTCNVILATQSPPLHSACVDASVDDMLSCIDGAITMYKNSPPQLKETVLVTLRAALISAVDTCHAALEQSNVPSSPLASHPPAIQPTTALSSPVKGIDSNTKALKTIYETMKEASGDGYLGLRSDLTAAEADHLAEQLVSMRSILLEEMEEGIPDPQDSSKSTNIKPVSESEVWEKATSQEISASSRYKEMLAKARAEKTRE